LASAGNTPPAGHRLASGLLLAQSPELPALMVPAQSIDEMLKRIPESIKEILEFTRARVASVTFEEDASNASFPRGFLPVTWFASTEIEAARQVA
jgi:hypothetical protein